MTLPAARTSSQGPAFEAYRAPDGSWTGISRAFGSTLTARSETGQGGWELVSLIHAGGQIDDRQQIVPAGVACALDQAVRAYGPDIPAP